MPSSSDEKSLVASLWHRIIEFPSTPRIVIAVACFLLIFAVTINDIANPRSASLIVGDVARKDYVAPYSAIYIDTEATNVARNESASEVGPAFSIDTAINNSMTSDLANFFLRLNELAGELRLIEHLDTQEEADVTDETETVQLENEAGEESADGTLTPPHNVVHLDREQSETAAIAELMAVLDENLLDRRQLTEFVEEGDLRELLTSDTSSRDSINTIIDRAIRERIIDLIYQDGIPLVLDDLRESILEKADLAGLSPLEGRLACRVAGYFIRPNAEPDQTATDSARNRAREATPPVQSEVRAGQIFLRAGEVVGQEDLDIMAALGITNDPGRRLGWLAILAFALVLGISFILSAFYLPGKGFIHFNDSRYYILFYTIITITYLSTFFLIQILRVGAQNEIILSLASLPIIGGTVLLAHYFTRQAALTVSGFLAIVITFAAGELSLLAPAVFTSIAAALIIRRDSPKPLLIRAIIVLPIVWAVVLIAMATTTTVDVTALTDRYWYLFAGIVPTPIAMILANYVLDSAFNIPTSNRLQEFDNQDHPLLKKLQLEAPGTWHHSMMVGMIAEAACQAIGGNTQLVRVASRFHDIGKIRRPEFFIENQRGGINLHDKYSPWLSKIIIEGHVKDGITMAKSFGLPQELIDTIPQHHGTSLITYFFRKALALSEDGYVNEYDYRYPGPKPQTPEAACVNIADAAESATRSLEEPTPHRIESLVNKIYEDRLLDGQFDECGLALNQLETIKMVIIGRLVAAYHTRIDYPEEEELRRQLQLKRAEGDKTAKPETPINNED